MPFHPTAVPGAVAKTAGWMIGCVTDEELADAINKIDEPREGEEES